MYFDESTVKLVFDGNNMFEGKLVLYEEAPDDNTQVLIEIYFNDQKVSKMDDNFFQALQNLREDLENKNIQIMCNGAAKNVYPSPMQMSMGSGRTAYLLKLSQQAKNADIVDIFGCMDTLIFVTVKEQESFYRDWIKSISQ